jgi:predicted Fe-Mo cluster-binding NifX family protein
MKIAFPLRNKTELAIDFIRCQTIGIYDEISQSLEYVSFNDNSNLSSSQFLDRFKSKGVDCVISPDFTCHELRSFRENNIKTYKASSMRIEGNVSRLISSTLYLFNRHDKYHVDVCYSDCTGCGSR